VVYGQRALIKKSAKHGIMTNSSLFGLMDSNVNLARRHTLDDNEKDAYLDAEKCLMDAPTSQNARLPMARTMFQALQEQHQLQSEHIHEVVSWLVSVIFVGIS